MTRIAVVWPGHTGYMGPCFRALAACCDVRLFIEPSRYEQRFDGEELKGLQWRRVEDQLEFARVAEELRAWRPHVLLVCGWNTPMSRYMARAGGISGVKVLDFDMPWEWSPRKILARWVLWPRLRHFDAAFVPGRRCARYARWLGFRGDRLIVGSNPSGWERFPSSVERTLRHGEGGRFLFVGRFVREKGLDILLKAYAAYRKAADEPWSLDLVGSGDALPTPLPVGVRMLGFVRPADMPRTLCEHDCLVLPSRWEPWGVCAAEAMCAGLLTILSERCGLVADARPTRIVPADDVRALMRAMTEVTGLTAEERRAEGMRARGQMERYSSENWARRVRTFATLAQGARERANDGSAGRQRRILHVVPGLDGRANGIAVAARLIAGGQRADGAEVELAETRQFADDPGDLSRWDEVWVHSMWLPETVRACRHVLKAGRPLVRMTHANLDPLRLRFRAWKKLPVWWLFERRLFATCSRVVVTCEAEADWCRAKGVACPIQTVDLKRFFDLKSPAPPVAASSPHLLYLGRCHPLKGVDALRAAVAAIGEPRIELRVVSDHFGDELERDWAWADVLVLPTLSENFGLVVAEALSRGKPVLTTDGAPAWENQPGVVCVRGYRDAPFAVRVRLLQDALRKFVATTPPSSQAAKER